MDCVARRLRYRGAIPLGCALIALWPSPLIAKGELDLLGRDTFELSGDVRVAAVDGEKSWLDGGFGKLRSGGSNTSIQPQLGNLSVAWKPQLTWALGAIIVGRFEGGHSSREGLSQAYVNWRPMRSSKVAFSARAGLMWPPVSLEHEGADWHVKDSITPSAINSWIGEEVKPLALEATLASDLGDHKLRATAALIAANDTAGTLLTFRGWALHDRTTLAFTREPLPPLDDFTGLQARYTHPLLDVHPGFGKRIGFYGKFAWQPPLPIRLEIFHYDNRAFPEDVTQPGPEWGWRTRFNDVGIVANLGSGTEFKSQALEGTTLMGFPMPVKRWVDERFRSAYAMIDHSVGKVTVSLRGDVFETKGRGSIWTSEYDEHGWAAMLSAKRSWNNVTGLFELLHVWSKSAARANIGEQSRQGQTELQAEVRTQW